MALRWVTVRGYIVFVCNHGHSRQLSLLTSAGREMSTQTEAVLCGWEGNRKSGVALAMRQDSVIYPPTGHRAQWPKERETRLHLHGASLYTPIRSMEPFYSFSLSLVRLLCQIKGQLSVASYYYGRPM